MRMRRVVTAAGAVVLVAATLAGCSRPVEWAIRLNADGSVDYLDCHGPMWQIHVDYVLEDEPPDGPVEWRALIAAVPAGEEPPDADPIDVAYYGDVPPGWTVDVPEHRPPADWVAVSTEAGFVRRETLEPGEWVWFTEGDLPWVPPHPCDGWEMGADGEPTPSTSAATSSTTGSSSASRSTTTRPSPRPATGPTSPRPAAGEWTYGAVGGMFIKAADSCTAPED